ncbi:hypothetical protein ScPMuIL_010199 [Solemya velum]
MLWKTCVVLVVVFIVVYNVGGQHYDKALRKQCQDQFKKCVNLSRRLWKVSVIVRAGCQFQLIACKKRAEL